MTFAGSIFLIVVGAILRFATHIHVKGLDLRTIGLILMIAGFVGLIVAIWQWAVWSRRSRQSEVLVDDRRVADPHHQQPPVGEYREPPGY
jgi:amino acid permease